MKDKELQELKNKNADLMKKACVYTNLAYALVEVADSIMVDTESILKKLGASISKSEKEKYKNVRRTGRIFKIWLKDLAKVVYNIDLANEALDDSDKLYDIIMLILDRCGGDMIILNNIKSTILDNYKSIYNYYK